MHATIFFLIGILLLLGCSSFAVGLGVNPAYLEFKIYSEKDLEQSLFVINTENASLDFNVYAVDYWFLIEPNHFSLPAGKKQEVLLRMKFSPSPQETQTEVRVVASEPGQNQVKTGIKMPVKILQLQDATLTDPNDSNSSEQNPQKALTGFFSLNGSSSLLGLLVIGLCALVVGLAKAKGLKGKIGIKYAKYDEK
ncbi:MAG: hypothetical protein V1777_05435 [Candidatus Micrarchaeota archaeon]